MIKKTIYTVTLLIAVGVLFAFNPEKYALFPRCPFHSLTGFACPGCGSQRALHCLLHLDIQRAFGYNALMISIIPYVFLLLFAEWKRLQYPRFYHRIQSRGILIGCLVIIILWGIIRNIWHL